MLQKAPEKPAEADIAAVLSEGRSSGRWRRIILVLAVAVVAAAGLWFWWSAGSGQAAVTYSTAQAVRGDLTVTVTATGTVEPTNQVEISSELSGMIGAVEVDFNDEVEAGQTLASLKTDKLEANVALAEASLAAREAEVQQAEISAAEAASAMERAQQLMDRGVVTQETYDTAKATADRADAALAAAEANRDTAAATLSINRSDLDKACICSPIDGVVLSRDVEVGQIVAASLSAPVLFTIADDLSKMQLQVDIDEADMGEVAEGDSAMFRVEAYENRTFPATISQIRYSPATVEGVVTYKAILTVDNSDLLLRPGMTATADITVEQVEDALLVSNAALRYAPPAAAEESDRGAGLLGLLMPRPPQQQTTSAVASDGRRTVWVLREGEPVAVLVETGASDGSRTEIVSGDLAVGDEVIVGSRTSR